MSVSDLENTLKHIEKTIKIPPRNEYEKNVLIEDSNQKLVDVRRKLSEFSGAHIDGLRKKADMLEKELLVLASEPVTEVVDGTFDADFGEADEVDELEMAEMAASAKPKKAKKSKAEKKEKTKKEKLKNVIEEQMKNTEIVAEVKSEAEVDNNSSKEEEPMPLRELYASPNSLSSTIPLECVAEGAACQLIENTAKASVLFKKEIDFDGKSTFCKANIFRSVLLVVSNLPKLKMSNLETIKEQIEQRTAALGKVDENSDTEEILEGGWDDCEDDPMDTKEVENYVENDSQHTAKLSDDLVAEYRLREEEKEELENVSQFPKEINEQLSLLLREVSFLTWTILICHGGYFAGGIFVNRKCVVHKSFQRYVVRKKQGGKQSTNAKDGGGSYGSIGSQIRAAQEAKWKIDVKNILLAWRPMIDASQFIFYVAPGPQNRSILTDFSLIPGETAESPIKLSDPRVRNAPLTTHKPKFEEIERIFTVLSAVDIYYVSY